MDAEQVTAHITQALNAYIPPHDIMLDLIRRGTYKNGLRFDVSKGTPADLRRSARAAYHDEEARLRAVFLADMAQAYDMLTHRKGPDVARMAWDEGHLNGLEEVLHWYDKLVDLVS